MNLRGLYKFSLVDYPGKISCIVFTGGCNFQCAFCHNPCLVFDPNSQPPVTETEFFNYLAKRNGLLEGVVITGGEPLIHDDVPEFIRKIHKAGYKVKLDTNGSFPDKLESILADPGVEALGLDYKTVSVNYNSVTGNPDPDLFQRVQRTIRLGVEARQKQDVQIDVRTTVHKRLHSESVLFAMRDELVELGVSQWTLQQFNPVEVIDSSLSEEPTYSDGELLVLARKLSIPELPEPSARNSAEAAAEACSAVAKSDNLESTSSKTVLRVRVRGLKGTIL